MKKPLVLALALASSIVCGAPAAMAQTAVADPGHPRVNEVEQRIQNQQDRVDKGVSDGQIDATQAARDDAKLAREQNSLNQDEAKNDGHITRAEQKNLNRRLNQGNRQIRRQRRAGAESGK
jgi:hypothetical protein